jgi:2-keto-3-deoxy-L-rhamnonate aldolase RhmA
MATAPFVRNTLAETLRGGGLGLAMITRHAHGAEIAAAAAACGFDAIYLDLEHTAITEAAAAQVCIAALLAGIAPLVRLPSHDAHYANRVLDNGALGIIAPHVENAEQARAIVQASRFAPLGRRSIAGSWPHLGYRPVPALEARAQLDAATMVVVMLETPAAIAQANAIAAVPGVDVLHVGATDLCDALGIPGQFDAPALRDCFVQVVAACQRHGKIAGAGGLANAPKVMQDIVRLGVRFVSAGNEWDFMLSAARQRVATLRELRLDGSIAPADRSSGHG